MSRGDRPRSRSRQGRTEIEPGCSAATSNSSPGGAPCRAPHARPGFKSPAAEGRPTIAAAVQIGAPRRSRQSRPQVSAHGPGHGRQGVMTSQMLPPCSPLPPAATGALSPSMQARRLDCPGLLCAQGANNPLDAGVSDVGRSRRLSDQAKPLTRAQRVAAADRAVVVEEGQLQAIRGPAVANQDGFQSPESAAGSTLPRGGLRSCRSKIPSSWASQPAPKQYSIVDATAVSGGSMHGPWPSAWAGIEAEPAQAPCRLGP